MFPRLFCAVSPVSAGNVSNVVNHVLVPVLGNKLCNELYKAMAPYKLTITEDQLCAGLEEGGKDACQVRDQRIT